MPFARRDHVTQRPPSPLWEASLRRCCLCHCGWVLGWFGLGGYNLDPGTDPRTGGREVLCVVWYG